MYTIPFNRRVPVFEVCDGDLCDAEDTLVRRSELGVRVLADFAKSSWTVGGLLVTFCGGATDVAGEEGGHGRDANENYTETGFKD